MGIHIMEWPAQITELEIARMRSMFGALVFRHSLQCTAGISSWFILWTCLFSSSQFGSHLSNKHERRPMGLIRNGSLEGMRAFTVFLGLFQAGVQWLANMILFIIFVSNRTELMDVTTQSHPGKLPPSISSTALIVIVVIHAVVCISLGLAILLAVDPEESGHFNRGLGCFHSSVVGIISIIYMTISIGLASYQYAPQIQTTLALKDSANISILSLALQLAVTLALAVYQTWRVPKEDFRQHFGPMWKQTKRPVLMWYYKAGWASVPWFVTAIGQAVLLGVCVRNRH
ncbi:hypothetical protein DL95DRAFT_501997 [Leptodontidium sp. 2 PMI_412]|nr:hypothetical protein DL95DRAFT_501997 [Leptodontidium sp. 2 PMI_412]